MKLAEGRVGREIAEESVRVMKEAVVMAAVLDLQTGCHG